MSVAFECTKCEADFELEVADVIDDPARVKCPNCGAKANQAIVEAAFVALDEFIQQARRLHRKFRISLSLEPDEIFDENEEEFTDELDDDETSLWEDDIDDEDDEDDM